MGKSNRFVQENYLRFLAINLGELRFDSVAFLACTGEDEFTSQVRASTRHFYDITLADEFKWDMNDVKGQLKQKYDLIVLTRALYFAKDPNVVIESCLRSLTLGGHLFADYGLGDHWRFKPFMVGWRRSKEHDPQSISYGDHRCTLWSCAWDDLLDVDPRAMEFREAIRRHGYDDDRTLKDIVVEEVPVLTHSYVDSCVSRETFCLWLNEDPQLYIMALYRS